MYYIFNWVLSALLFEFAAFVLQAVYQHCSNVKMCILLIWALLRSCYKMLAAACFGAC